MSTTVEKHTVLNWQESTPGAWKWLTFGDLVDIVDKGRGLIPVDTFAYVKIEYADDDAMYRVDGLRLKAEESL